MRYPASEKLEILQLVEQSHLPVRRTLGQLGIAPSTFYRWYDLYQTGGPEALEDRSKAVAVPLAVVRWYDFHEFGGYLGNVG